MKTVTNGHVMAHTEKRRKRVTDKEKYGEREREKQTAMNRQIGRSENWAGRTTYTYRIDGFTPMNSYAIWCQCQGGQTYLRKRNLRYAAHIYAAHLLTFTPGRIIHYPQLQNWNAIRVYFRG